MHRLPIPPRTEALDRGAAMTDKEIDGACYGPYLVKFEDHTTPEELEQVLRAMEPNRRKAFLKGAAI